MEPKQAAWHWQLRGGTGVALTLAAADQRFASRSDAETWLGESWPELWDAGVVDVVLYDEERLASEPLALRPGPADRAPRGPSSSEPVSH